MTKRQNYDIMERARAIVSTLIALLLLITVAGPATMQEPEGVERLTPSQPAGSCSPTLGGPGASHPLQGITIEHSRELEGREKDLVVRRVLQAPDVRNVLKDSSMKFDPAKAMAVMHTLDTGNTLLAVVIPAEKWGLIYYELAKPLVERDPEGRGYKSIYKSQAMLLAIEGETVKLVATSVNGRPPRKAGIASLGSPPCGGCVSIFGPWEYESGYCISWNAGCLIGCGLSCARCGPPCYRCISSGQSCGDCIVCALTCAACPFICCERWGSTCVTCGSLTSLP
jgi:hypothetical protein